MVIRPHVGTHEKESGANELRWRDARVCFGMSQRRDGPRRNVALEAPIIPEGVGVDPALVCRSHAYARGRGSGTTRGAGGRETHDAVRHAVVLAHRVVQVARSILESTER